MTKRILITMLALGLTMNVSSCSSGGNKEDGDVAESNDSNFQKENEGDFAEKPADGDAAKPPDDAAATDKVADNLDDLGGAPPVVEGDKSQPPAADGAAAGTTADAAGAKPDDLVLDPAAEPLPDAVASGSDPGASPAPAPVADAKPPTDEPVFNTPPAADASPAPAPSDVAATTPEPAPAPAPEPAPVAAAEPPAQHTYAPLKKVREAAFASKSGTNLNRVYLARPGDTLKGISQKIYGKNRTKDLKAWNGKSSVHVGDKIYYASPNDAGDTSMKTFYEDIGVQPSTYTSKDGDNIRKVAKQLLGNSQSWKEVWATNPSVESKGNIPAGLEIRYWPEGAESTASGLAKADVPHKEAKSPASGAGTMGDMGQDLPPPPSETSDLPPPPPADTGSNLAMGDTAPNGDPGKANMAAPPPPPPPPPTGGAPGAQAGAAAGSAQAVPPPPPPPADIPPPPPEPKPVAKKMQPLDKSASVESDPDQMMWLGAGGIMVMAAAILYVVIKKSRAKRVDLSQTQI